MNDFLVKWRSMAERLRFGVAEGLNGIVRFLREKPVRGSFYSWDAQSERDLIISAAEICRRCPALKWCDPKFAMDSKAPPSISMIVGGKQIEDAVCDLRNQGFEIYMQSPQEQAELIGTAGAISSKNIVLQRESGNQKIYYTPIRPA